MPTPPTNSGSRSAGSAKPKAPARKKPATVAASGVDGDGVLVDKTVQKTTRKVPVGKTAAKAPKAPKSSFEKPAEAEWHRMISEAAYYRAETRGFQPGYEHEDWAWAEEEVRKILSP